MSISKFERSVNGMAFSVAASDGVDASNDEVEAGYESTESSISGAVLLSGISDVIWRHLWISQAEADAIALWAAFTTIYQHFPYCPNLLFNSPVKRCGKSRGLEVVSHLVCEEGIREAHSRYTPAALSAMLRTSGYIPLLDEFDQNTQNREGLINLMNGAYQRATASSVIGAPGGLAGSLSIFCPMAIAAIGRQDSRIEDRSIKIRINRKPVGVFVEQLQPEPFREVLPGDVHSALEDWTNSQLNQILHHEPQFPVYLHDRARDNWRPLLSIGAAAGSGWEARAYQAAAAIENRSFEDEDAAVLLIRAIAGLCADLPGSMDVVQTNYLVTSINRDYDSGDLYWMKAPLTAHSLARKLDAFGVHPSGSRIRVNGKQPRGYWRGDLERLFRSYAPAESGTSGTAEPARSLSLVRTAQR